MESTPGALQAGEHLFQAWRSPVRLYPWRTHAGPFQEQGLLRLVMLPWLFMSSWTAGKQGKFGSGAATVTRQ